MYTLIQLIIFVGCRIQASDFRNLMLLYFPIQCTCIQFVSDSTCSVVTRHILCKSDGVILLNIFLYTSGEVYVYWNPYDFMSRLNTKHYRSHVAVSRSDRRMTHVVTLSCTDYTHMITIHIKILWKIRLVEWGPT